MQQRVALSQGQLIPDILIRRDRPAVRVHRMIKQAPTGPCEAHDVACILQGLG